MTTSDLAPIDSRAAARRARRLAIFAGLCALAWLLWAARSLILPCLAAAIMAYVCRSLVELLEQRGIPRRLAIVVLVLLALTAAVGAAYAIRSAVPSDEAIAEIKIRAARVVDKGYADAIGLAGQSSSAGRLLHREGDPLVAKAKDFLALDSDEEAAVLVTHPVTQPLGAIAHALPAWITAFLLFVFILKDAGEMKRALVACVPNRFFEPVLSILSDLDKALRRYARALFTQCVLLGGTVALTQMIAGIPLRWAAVIGFFAGMANVMPYAGTTTALLGGLAYALLGGEIQSPLPFVDAENFPIAVLVAVVVTDTIKNVFYDPIVMGGAVRLHPVAIILGVAAGAEAFGIIGALFAVPAISLAVAFTASVLRQLRAYGEI